jgi:pimeloyl-ACP methyl ester carboxylesterase
MQPQTRVRSTKNLLVGGIVGTTLTAGLGWIAYSSLFIPDKLPMPPAVTEGPHQLSGKAGPLSYYAAGSGGRPLLLIHSINAAASAYEMRPLFEHYRQSRRVYAPDLPGFGFSDRSDRDYTPRLYTDAIIDMLDLIAQEVGDTPVDAIGLSLGCEFLARAASEHPERFNTVALMIPTGLRKGDKSYGAPGSTRQVPLLREFFSFPLWSRPFFKLLNTRASQRYFMERVFSSCSAVDPDLLEYYYLTAHQPGAEYAPYAFVSGKLFSTDIGHVYDSLTMPVWLAYGSLGEFSNIDTERLAGHSNWSIETFPSGGMIHFERLDDLCAAYDSFLVAHKA